MNKELIRLLISGSVDDGKSTLLGKLLYETNHVYKDQYEAIKNESKKYGTHGSKADLALLIDGLQDEREQGITIDVAYRYFESPNKKFIIADTPGHKQYTKNMATAASNSQIAVILIDVRNGITDQTRLHSFIISLYKLENIISSNIKSEGLVRGAIQVPADGNPIIMLSDHGTIGGYPKIGVVISADLDRVGQLIPGSIINFKEVSLEEAQNIFKAYTDDTDKYLNENN